MINSKTTNIMRIAILTDTYIPDKNGITTSIDNFTKLMADDGHQVMILAPKGTRYKDKKYPNITVKRYASFMAPSYDDMQIALPFIWTMVKDLKEFNPDVVHIQTPLGIGLIGIWATKILKIKNIQTYHTYIPDFLVYLSPKSLMGIDKITKYLESKKLAKEIERSKQAEDDSYIKTKVKAFFDSLKKEKDLEEEKKTSKVNDMLGRDYTRLVYNRADLVLTPSESMSKVLVEQGVTSPVKTMSNGINYNLFKKKTDFKIKNRAVYIGRLGYEKNVDVVVRAFDIVQNINPNARLDVYGDGPANKMLRSLVHGLGIGSKVKFMGAYDINKVSQKLCDYDFFVTASNIETQGIVILEAMAAGLPVLGVDALAVPEVILDGKNGFVSKPFDHEGMARNMLKLLSSDKQLKEFGKKSLEIAKTHEVSVCKDRLIDYYKNFIRS